MPLTFSSPNATAQYSPGKSRLGRASERAVEMRVTFRSLHLLALTKALARHRVDGALHEPSGDAVHGKELDPDFKGRLFSFLQGYIVDIYSDRDPLVIRPCGSGVVDRS